MNGAENFGVEALNSFPIPTHIPHVMHFFFVSGVNTSDLSLGMKIIVNACNALLTDSLGYLAIANAVRLTDGSGGTAAPRSVIVKKSRQRTHASIITNGVKL